MDPNHSGGHKIRAEEGHHAAERVPLRPQHRRQRHVAHRADEGKEGDDRRDGGVLKHSEEGEALPAASANEEGVPKDLRRSEGHTSELQSLMRISYAVFCLKKKTT